VTTLADLFDAAMNRALRNEKRRDAAAFADSAAFLRANGMESMLGLQKKASEMWGRCSNITERIKQMEKKLHGRQK